MSATSIETASSPSFNTDVFALSGLTLEQCQSARRSRDSRFDGRFFVAVKTTGIFCRPICPANLPKEVNVEYFINQAQALQSGYRPCLRCRPDSAPGSWAWKGVETTFQRAVKMIDQGELQSSYMPALAERLGISDRYLRQLFQRYLGMSPKQYAQYQQLMFAKQLLHTSNMSIAEIAIASGFNSIRRFNDAFQKKLKLTPSNIRRATDPPEHSTNTAMTKRLRLSYREPFNWEHLLAFYAKRAVRGVEDVGDNYYARTFVVGMTKGWFSAERVGKNVLEITFDIDDMAQLKNMVSQIRRIFDLDANIMVIEQHLKQTVIAPMVGSGIRIPGVWNAWEAGLRAVFGQQVSITTATTMLNRFIQNLSGPEDRRINHENTAKADTLFRYFPTPAEVANADLSALKMPQNRKDTLKRFAQYMTGHITAEPEEWLALKGIGPWTVSYAKLRGQSQPDCFLYTDLVIKKALATLSVHDPEIITKMVSPWGSYATFNCWNSQP